MKVICAFLFIAVAFSVDVPQQLHLAITGFPGEMVVQWVTLQTSNSVVQYGSSPSKLTNQVSGVSTPFVDGGSLHRKIFVHYATMKNLLPATQYFYRVGDNNLGVWSEIYSFKTLPSSKKDPITIALYGDMGVINGRSVAKITEDVENKAIDMVIHVGDFAYDMHDDNGTNGDTFMNNIEPIASEVPYMVCVGNHETAYNFSHYTNRFSGIDGKYSKSNTNWFYSFDVSYVHFVAITTEVYYHDDLIDSVIAQYNWLKQDLAKANANRKNVPWIIVFGHRPMYCSNVDDLPDCSTDAERLRTGINGTYGMEDILGEFNVDVYFTAHEHSYERTFPVFQNQIDIWQWNHSYVNPKFPVHILTGAGGCKEDLDYYDEVFYGPWSVVRSSSYGYGHLKIINETTLHWAQFLSEGASVDDLWITKDASVDSITDQVQVVASPGCDVYCVVTCESRAKKEGRSVEDCLQICKCDNEEKKILEDGKALCYSQKDKVILRGK